MSNKELPPVGGAEGDGHGPKSLSPCHLVVGLIGGIGSGKSQVAAAFAAKGARVVSGDQLAHEALRQPEMGDRIAERWGRDLIDEKGEINRRRLAGIVFTDTAERRALEKLVHPWIRRRIQEEVEAARHDPNVRLIVLDAAIMLEAGWDGVCDRLVYVDAPRPLRLRRVAEQRGWTEKEVEARENAQMPLTEKAARADHVLENVASLAHLDCQVENLLRSWGLAPARAGGS